MWKGGLAMKFTVTLIATKTASGSSNARRFPGCVEPRSQTKEEAIENIKDAIKLCPGSPPRAGCRSRSK